METIKSGLKVSTTDGKIFTGCNARAVVNEMAYCDWQANGKYHYMKNVKARLASLGIRITYSSKRFMSFLLEMKRVGLIQTIEIIEKGKP